MVHITGVVTMIETIPTANLLRQYGRHAVAIKQPTEKIGISGQTGSDS